MARSTRRQPRKGGKRDVKTRRGGKRRQRGGINCANSKINNSTGLQRLDSAMETAKKALKQGELAKVEALSMNSRALETAGGKALVGSIESMNEAIGQLELAAGHLMQSHECMFAEATPQSKAVDGMVTTLPNEPGAGRPVRTRRWWNPWTW
jgi:hypothetical protein